MIRLRSLTIRNFRGIREGSLDGFADVNVLVGRNNSGKTTVVEAITRAATIGGLRHDIFDRTVDGLWQQVRRVTGLPGVGHEAAGGDYTLWYRQIVTKDISIIATLANSTGSAGNVGLEYKLSGKLPLARVDASERANGNQPWTPFCSGVTVFRPTSAFDTSIEQRFWPRILSNRKDRVLTQALNDVFGLDAESFQLLPENKLMVLFHDFSLPLDLQGDGTRAATRTLMCLTVLQDTLFILEEPECHQHPGSLERFAAALCKLAKAQSVQLIVSTHSADCVRHFLRGAMEANSESAVFHLNLTDGLQTSRRLDAEAVETLTDTGIDIRFLDLYA
jgi:hypothetical protein